MGKTAYYKFAPDQENWCLVLWREGSYCHGLLMGFPEEFDWALLEAQCTAAVALVQEGLLIFLDGLALLSPSHPYQEGAL